MSRITTVLSLALLPLLAGPGVAHADPNPCEGLDPDAFQGAIDALDEAIDLAEENLAVHPVNTHTYFGEGARDYFLEARDAIVDQQEWLQNNSLDEPFVSNTSAAGGSYYVFMFQASYAVTHAVWYAGLSAIYTESDEAKAAADLGGEINTMLTELGSFSMGCYMRPTFPATW